MNNLKKYKEIFRFQEMEVELWLPDLEALQLTYQNERAKTAFPYWAKLWPSAYVLTAFINEHRDLINNKKVLELAAGIGLPSLFASMFASSVLCSDYDATAVEFIQMNIALNNISNMQCVKFDWTELPPTLDFDVLLLSDINYNPADFETLKLLIQKNLASGKTILLSTPQRLAGKAFIAELLPWGVLNEEHWHDQTAINVLVLKKQ
jgi:predicted nicotinamide N-methyase